MAFYMLIHWVSLVLAGAALVILLGLVALQAIRNRRTRYESTRRESLLKLALNTSRSRSFCPPSRRS